MKNSFVLYTDYKQHIDLLTTEEKAQLLDAIFGYAEGNEIELDGATKMAFSFIKAQMDRDNDKYQETCEKRRAAGAKGGAPAGNTNAKKQAKQANGCLNKQNNQKQAKQPDTDTDNDNDTDTDTDNDTVTVTDKDKKESEKKKAHGANNNVKLFDREYAMLVSEYGVNQTNRLIAYLDDYMEERPEYKRKTKSHYRTIKRWVVDAVKEQDNRRTPRGQPQNDFFADIMGGDTG